jgi:DoxX
LWILPTTGNASSYLITNEEDVSVEETQTAAYFNDRSVTNLAFPHLNDVELSSRFSVAPFAPISLRLIVGFGFMQHGFAKLSRGPDAFAAILQLLGVPSPHFMAWVSILTELLGGLAILWVPSWHLSAYRWRYFYWWLYLPYICRMDSVRSSS